jgi:RNA polymerase sigma-70 factor (ECF subfamily)
MWDGQSCPSVWLADGQDCPSYGEISLTSGESIRLWLVAGSGDGRQPAAVPAQAAAARIKPTVTLSLEQHVETVYRYALRLAGRRDLAEDLTQETLLHAWRSREKLRDPQVARVWLLRIATNLWTDQLRRTRFQPGALSGEPPCPYRVPERAILESEQVRLALAAMDELPPRQRQVLYLITCQQQSQTEVAEVLGIEKSTVKANLSLARKEMRRRLKDVYESVCGRRTCNQP